MSAEQPSAVDRHVLVVEDDELVRAFLARLLRRHGYEVITAEDADEAMTQLVQTPCPVMLTDLWMPGLSGHELARWVKERYPATEVVFVTG